MDNIFSGYLPKKKTEINEIIKFGNIVFDSSSIFNLYRYKKSTSNQILSYLEKVKQRLHLPYMVGIEYHDNRVTILNQQRAIYEKLNTKVEQLKSSISDQFLNEHHSSVEYEDVNKIVNKFQSELNQYLERCKKSHPNYLINDPIREKLVDIFRNRTGKSISTEKLEELYATGDDRFSKEIPPGYKDAKNKEKIVKNYGSQQIRSKYADFIIWKEILELGQASQKSTLLICDEKKSDWRWEEHGYDLGPRPELITEYKQKSGKSFHMISLLDFFNKLEELNLVELPENVMLDIKSSSNLSWKEEVIKAFSQLGGIANLNQVYSYIEQHSTKKLTKEWKGTVRKAIYYYCSERDLFMGKENLFKALSNSKYQLLDYTKSS